MKIKVTAIAYHRNGVAGTGFYIVCFTWRDPEFRRTRHMLSTIFPAPGVLSVLDIDETMAHNIAFAQGNSWRGDDFEPALRTAIAHYQDGISRTS